MEIKKLKNINQVRLTNPNLSKNYSTHNAMLLKIFQLSKGDVVECGGGIFSTPLLHWACKLADRKLISYEQDPAYYQFERQFQSRQHIIRFVENWDDIDTKTHRGMVFIDHHPPERRMIELERFKDSADYIVVHDTERESREYNRQEVFDLFKYKYTWKGCRPWTSVFSNFHDLSNL